MVQDQGRVEPIQRTALSAVREQPNGLLGRRLVVDITFNDISDLQSKRLKEGMSGRTVNAEIGVLRQILKHFGLWTHLADRARLMRERRDTGRALTTDDESRLVEAAGQSRSPVLLPLFVTALDTGLRASELRNLRDSDLHAVWKGGAIQTGDIVVSRSKTEGGTGRIVPLTNRARAALSLWLSRFPGAQPASFIFPHHQIGFAGDSRLPYVYDIDLTIPISEWKSAWTQRVKLQNWITAGTTYGTPSSPALPRIRASASRQSPRSPVTSQSGCSNGTRM
jgi:integrase